MRGTILGLIPVVEVSRNAELTAGALHRYLAEAVWFPSALFSSPELTWSEIQDDKARATLEIANGITVSADFTFTSAGDVAEVFVDARFREVNGRFEPTPWRASFDGHRGEGPFRIPTRGEVAWLLPDGELPYWRGEVVEVEYR